MFDLNVGNDRAFTLGSRREFQGVHHANVRTRLSKILSFLAMSFPREDYSANKFIANGDEVYEDFTCQQGGPVNLA